MSNTPDPKSSEMWKGLFHVGVVWEAENLPTVRLLLSNGFVRAVENPNGGVSKRAEWFECPCAHQK